MTDLDGKLVRLNCDILYPSDDTEEILIDGGTEFIWDDSSIDQNIDGILVFVDNTEVELVEND
tara:strand:+ start:768 stop:956 length:189 start_codon:yes stop_codon:yes gene_type:complete